jgi:hypothetical protein
MLATGGIYSGRNAMVRFRFGNLDIAFVKPDAVEKVDECGTNAPKCVETIEVDTDGDGDIDLARGAVFTDYPCSTGLVSDTDVKFPRLEGRYLFQMAGVTLELGAAWQKYDVVGKFDEDGSPCIDCDDFDDEEEEDITSWFLYLGGKYSLGHSRSVATSGSPRTPAT